MKYQPLATFLLQERIELTVRHTTGISRLKNALNVTTDTGQIETALHADHVTSSVRSWRRGIQDVWSEPRTCGCAWGRTTPPGWPACLWRAAPYGMFCSTVSHRQILLLLTCTNKIIVSVYKDVNVYHIINSIHMSKEVTACHTIKR